MSSLQAFHAGMMPRPGQRCKQMRLGSTGAGVAAVASASEIRYKGWWQRPVLFLAGELLASMPGRILSLAEILG